MRIATANEIEMRKEAWPLFFQPGYIAHQKALGNNYYIIITDEDIAIPLKVRHRVMFKIGQYTYKPLQRGNALSADEEVMFMERFHTFCKSNKLCDFILPQSHHFSNFTAVPSGSYYNSIGIITVMLDRSEEEIFAACSSSYRTQIRKAIANHVKIVFDTTALDTFYTLYELVHKPQGVYYDSKEELKQMLDKIGAENYFFAFAEHNGITEFGILVFKGGKNGIYYHGGAVDKPQLQGTNKLLHYEVMKKLKAEGVTEYVMGGYREGDISGTKYEGLQNFKMKFGAVAVPGYHYYSMLGAKYYLYKLAMGLYLKAKGIKENSAGIKYVKK